MQTVLKEGDGMVYITLVFYVTALLQLPFPISEGFTYEWGRDDVGRAVSLCCGIDCRYSTKPQEKCFFIHPWSPLKRQAGRAQTGMSQIPRAAVRVGTFLMDTEDQGGGVVHHAALGHKNDTGGNNERGP